MFLPPYKLGDAQISIFLDSIAMLWEDITACLFNLVKWKLTHLSFHFWQCWKNRDFQKKPNQTKQKIIKQS